MPRGREDIRMIPITVKLFASLRTLAPCGPAGEIETEVAGGTSVEGVVAALGIPKERVRMIMINGIVAAFADPVKEGDRVALFPPEVAFNLYVALNFREDLRRDK
jgi:molybdopterin converting factor small subunit